MAEEDAEIAMLHQMQAGQAEMTWGDGAGVAEGENTENSDQVKEDTSADDQVLRAFSPSATADFVSSDVQSPLVTVAESTSQQNSRASSKGPTPTSKRIGGFIADDSDEEEEEYVPEMQVPVQDLLQAPMGGSAGISRSASRSPLPALTEQSSQPTPVATPVPSFIPGAVKSSNAGESSAKPVAKPAVVSNAAASIPKARLPHDTVGILEDRIKEDPRGDIEAWLALIDEHRKRNKLDDARAVYDRFLKVFPSAADIWVAYAEMELGNDNFYGAEQIFGKSLLSVPNVQLWSVYINYIRRRNDLTNDVSGTARATISQSYEFVLANIGIDRDSGRIWQEYIEFIRSAPGQIGGSTWQDQQKMDQMRKAYQRAVCVPVANVAALWKEYDTFEMSLNKMTGRKFIQEKSPSYMTARSANTALDNITNGLVRANLPHLPPALGFEGDQEYLHQVSLWRRWVSWEQEDPLVLQDEDLQAYHGRILYVFKQAVMALRFWPEIWIEAAEWCFANNLEKEGNDFLSQGIAANPESTLLAFKHADRLETVLPIEEGDEGVASRGAAIREPYNKLLDALYELIKKLKSREIKELAKIEENAALDAQISAVIQKVEEDDDDAEQMDRAAKDAAKANQIQAVQKGYAMQTQLLSRTISFAWIGLMRAMRRVQGKGKVGAIVGGSRQILNDARLRGKITSDVYVASALIEHNVYKDPAGTKIFERGAKLFPEDDIFILEYLKHLLSIGDTTNARAVFETSVNRLAQKTELVAKSKPLYVYFHKYESEYGELSQISKLEQRMADLFPEDPKLSRFASRYTSGGFDPTAVRPIISPATQMRPKTIMQSIEQANTAQDSPRPQYREISPRPPYRQENSPRPVYLQANNSPKRPFGGDDSDNDSNRPRKLARGESPLKGAAGRRLDQQKRLLGGPAAYQSYGPPPFVVPRDITFLLSIIPRAETYTSTKFDAEKMVKLLGRTEIPDYSAWKASRNQPMVDQYGRDLRR